MLYKQQAYYIDNDKLFFVDRENSFASEEDAYRNLERFAERTSNRIQNKSYNCIVTELKPKQTKEKTIIDLLVDKLL